MQILSSLLQLVFPPLCLHCRELQSSHRDLLCPVCLDLLHLIELEERCVICFAPLMEGLGRRCVRCNHSSFRHAAAFEYQGPASTLTRQFKYSGRVHLAEAMAGYMAVQFFRVDWPLPDLIVPVPLSFSHFMTRGYNQSQLLAEQLGKILNRPVASVLKRRSGDFSQSGLDKQLRQKLLSHSFSLKKKTDLSDKIILLIDDVATTKTTLSHCVSLLQDAYPAKIYALTFCIA